MHIYILGDTYKLYMLPYKKYTKYLIREGDWQYDPFWIICLFLQLVKEFAEIILNVEKIIKNVANGYTNVNIV